MFQEESIYNILPCKSIFPQKPKMYRSMYPSWIAPTASTFILNNTSYPNVANCGGTVEFPRGAHPIRGGWRSFGLPKGGYKVNPEHFVRKGHQYKIVPPPERLRSTNEVRKPAVVTAAEKPIMGLKSEKNYVQSNAIDNILMEPRKRKIPNDTDLDFYMHKEDYGKVPAYLRRAQSARQRNIQESLRVQEENKRYKAAMNKVIDGDELTQLREGLTKKLAQLRAEYGRIAHRRKFDTLTTKNYKERLETEIEQVEKDLAMISKDVVTVDLTK